MPLRITHALLPCVAALTLHPVAVPRAHTVTMASESLEVSVARSESGSLGVEVDKSNVIARCADQPSLALVHTTRAAQRGARRASWPPPKIHPVPSARSSQSTRRVQCSSLALGDKIVAVDGVALDGRHISAVLEPGKSEYAFVVERDGAAAAEALERLCARLCDEAAEAEREPEARRCEDVTM